MLIYIHISILQTSTLVDFNYMVAVLFLSTWTCDSTILLLHFIPNSSGSKSTLATHIHDKLLNKATCTNLMAGHWNRSWLGCFPWLHFILRSICSILDNLSEYAWTWSTLKCQKVPLGSYFHMIGLKWVKYVPVYIYMVPDWRARVKATEFILTEHRTYRQLEVMIVEGVQAK